MSARYDPVVKPLITCWLKTSSAVITVSHSAFHTPYMLPSSLALHGRADTLGVDEFPVFDRPTHHVSAVRVAVLVKVKLASDALKILGLAHRFHDSSTLLLASALDGLKGDNGGLVGIQGPANRFCLVGLHVVLVKPLADIGRELIGWKGSEGDIRVVVHRRWGGLLNHGRGIEPVWPHKFDLLVEESQRLHLLEHLHPARINHKTAIDQIRPRGFDLGQQGPEVEVH